MRYFALAILALTLSFASSPSEAAPKWIEQVCFHESSKRAFNGRGEREQFVTNCIADLVAAPASERRAYRKRYKGRY